ncbi:hypothetical protein FK545_11260 [Planococcus glaciei]|nr:hypothetical protein [Planococcus glaciei]QDY45792.1 hypothetical protein FK545_11260 [Planococcus glaciei]
MKKKKKAKELLALISLFDFISNKQLFELIDNNSEYNDLIEEFLATGICENLGSNKEYLCLNSAVKNYIRRKKFSIGDIFEYKLNKDVKSFVTSYESEFEKDVSEILFYAKKAITSGIRMEERFLIPSHFLKSMKELYDKRDRDSDVVILADRILNYENVMDEQIAREIRYFLCSSLARLKDTRFKKEVQNIRGAEHHFLFGFYYRHVGRDEEAVSSLLKAMESRANFARAKRELVLVYNNMEEYDKALELAKENYQHNRSNEYHIQAYFLCLSKGKSEKLAFENRKRTIEILLEDMKKIDSEKAKNMYLIMSAQYEIFMKDNSKEAEKIILEAYDLYPSDTYVLLCMFDIYERSLNIEGLNKVLEDFKKLHGTDRSKFHKDYLKCKAVYLALKDDVDSAHQIIRKLNISESSKKNLEQRIERNKLRLVK